MLRVADRGEPHPEFLECFTVEHSLVGHQLLAWEAIAALAGRLPDGSIEIGGDQSAVVAGLNYERRLLGGDAEAAVLALENQERSLYFYDVETDPEGEIALEALHSGRYGSCGSEPSGLELYELGPGEGFLIPPRAAHYVETGPRTSTARLSSCWSAAPGISSRRDRLRRESFTMVRAVVSKARAVRGGSTS